MGYRSEVALCMYANKIEDAPVIKLWIKENFPVDEWSEYIRWTDKGMLLHADHIKWYDDYKEINEVHAAMDEFAELFARRDSHTHGAYEFIRIGEDMNDINEQNVGHIEWLISVERKITTEVTYDVK